MGQGYLLGRPQLAVTESIELDAVPGWHHSPDSRAAVAPSADTIGRLAVMPATLESGAELRAAVGLFETHHADSVVVLRAAKPVGLVMKSHAYQLLGQAFGREVYLRRPVDLAATRPLTVDHRCPLEEVSRLAMRRDARTLYDHIIVTADGILAGIVSVQRLLAAITDARVDAARNANPLTGLPGNAVIERELRSRMRGSDRVALMHIDLDDFKAFNDVYGFHRGDAAIMMTAELLSHELDSIGGQRFLGHIGGDDFLAIVEAGAAHPFAERLAPEFARRVAALYDDAHRLDGFIAAPNRTGEHEIFPLMTLSVAMAFVEPNDPRHYAELLDALSGAKRDAKIRKRERRNSAGGVRALAG